MPLYTHKVSISSIIHRSVLICKCNTCQLRQNKERPAHPHDKSMSMHRAAWFRDSSLYIFSLLSESTRPEICRTRVRIQIGGEPSAVHDVLGDIVFLLCCDSLIRVEGCDDIRVGLEYIRDRYGSLFSIRVKNKGLLSADVHTGHSTSVPSPFGSPVARKFLR